MNRKLSTKPYKGVRDFYPEDQFIQNYIFDVWTVVAESYGYQEYNSSILEPTELYTAKTSQEIVDEQTYTFTDRGDRSVTLRPEMTPSVSRMIAHKRRELPLPLRWFSIGNMFRYERPQHGRLREHWQLNADIFGLEGPDAEIEIISVANAIMLGFGATSEDFVFKINNRGIVREHLIQGGLSNSQAEIELSKMDKGASKIEYAQSVEAIEELRSKLADRGIKNIEHDQNLVRGFSYYTGTVFEVYDTNDRNNRSLFGGGRYDGLVEKFEGEPIPAVGFGLGDVTMRDFLETHELLPKFFSSSDLCVCYASEENKEDVDIIVRELRSNGLNITTADKTKKVSEQVKYADKLKIPYVLCIGKEEFESEIFIIKKLDTGQEVKLTKDKIADFIFGDL